MPPPPASALADAVNRLHQNLASVADELLVTRQKLYAMEARDLLLERGTKPRRPIEFRSQFGEDLWIWDVLGGQTEGFYIEAGAFDGYHYSVTYGLEAIGWTGLLVEPLPGPAQACRERRPHSRVVQTAISRQGSAGTVKFVNVQDHYGGMLSFIQAPTEHARKIAGVNYKTDVLEVPVTSLNELLKDHQGPIDVAMIDVEGAELDVLNGFDLLRFRPRLLILEENTHGANPAVAQYMATKPYVHAGWLGVNMMYVRADEEKMLDRLRRY